MERLRRLTEFWNWLPAFRAVAETEHLPTAAKELRLSPSSLSRSIHLLERNLGKSLFHREGRRLRLNAAGDEFLAAVRTSLRLVDEGFCAVTHLQEHGPLFLAASEVLSWALLPALRQIRAEHPMLVVHLYGQEAATEAVRLLLRGDLDLALLPEPVANERLQVERLGTVRNGIYCGPGHPLFNARRPSRKRILEHAFVALAPVDAGVALERWPVEIPRRVKAHVTRLQLAVEICATGGALTVLPDPLARTSLHSLSLRRMPLNV